MGACLVRCPRRRRSDAADPELIPLVQRQRVPTTLPDGLGVVFEEGDGTKIFYGPTGVSITTRTPGGQWVATHTPRQDCSATLRQSPTLVRKAPAFCMESA